MNNTEFKSFIKVWILAITSLCYCYYISVRLQEGLPRLLSLLPVIYLFFIFPLSLSSVHLCGITAFLLSWLANFKLLLFSFDRGPLSPPPSKLSHFISIACLPIKLKKLDPSSQTSSNTKNSHQNVQSSNSDANSSLGTSRIYEYASLALKFVLLASIFHVYEYRQYLPKYVILVLYCCHIYLQLEIVLALCATPARALLGFELEPHFDRPYLATSLQDFWGRRWNLMVTRILHPAVYSPIRLLSTRLVGPEWASLPAVLATFAVSGLVHELIYYYFSHVYPTWEVTCFFILHGVCVAAEVAVKKVVSTDRWRLPTVISIPLTVGFVVVTGFWLFFAQMVKYGLDEKLVQESVLLLNFMKERLAILKKTI